MRIKGKKRRKSQKNFSGHGNSPKDIGSYYWKTIDLPSKPLTKLHVFRVRGITYTYYTDENNIIYCNKESLWQIKVFYRYKEYETTDSKKAHELQNKYRYPEDFEK